MKKGTYVDGFVLMIPKRNAAAYRKMAREAMKVWMRFGALDYKECMLDDVRPPMVTLTFPKLVRAKPSEAVWYSFIVYKDKRHRDAVNKKVMGYFSKKYTKEQMEKGMPFDMKRMSYGGFKVQVGA
jgi:uncharacterized protein YbaA (DUF1428 family)